MKTVLKLDINQILNYHNDGLRPRQIAKLLSVSSDTICNLLYQDAEDLFLPRKYFVAKNKYPSVIDVKPITLPTLVRVDNKLFSSNDPIKNITNWQYPGVIQVKDFDINRYDV